MQMRMEMMDGIWLEIFSSDPIYMIKTNILSIKKRGNKYPATIQKYHNEISD